MNVHIMSWLCILRFFGALDFLDQILQVGKVSNTIILSEEYMHNRTPHLTSSLETFVIPNHSIIVIFKPRAGEPIEVELPYK